MTVPRIYNEFVSGHFDRDPFRIYGDSRERALAQIRKHRRAGTKSIVDLGLGTGDLLSVLHDLFPDASLLGIDASDKMIEAAKVKFENAEKEGIAVVHDDIHHMDRHVAADSVDLLTMHFLMSFIDPRKVLPAAHGVLKPGGLFSVTTATEESFAALRTLAQNIWSDEIIRGETRTVENTVALIQTLAGSGFRSVDSETFVKEIVFQDLQSLKDFSFHAGWCASKFLFDMSDEDLKACEEVAKAFLPFHDSVNVAVVLAEKSG